MNNAVLYSISFVPLSDLALSFSYWSQETQDRFYLSVTKIQFAENIKGELIDPFPDHPCERVPCEVTPHALFYSPHFTATPKDECFLLELVEISGVLMLYEEPDTFFITFSSTSHEKDLTFSIDVGSNIQCTIQYRKVYQSNEGVLVSFSKSDAGLDGIEYLLSRLNMSKYSSPNAIRPISPHISTRVRRGVVSTKNFDMVPIAQQNNWLFTRMTTEEAGLVHLITTQTNDQLHDLFLLRHLVCVNRKKAELIAFYLSKQFPMPYLKLRFPEDSLTFTSRDPLKGKKGTSMIMDWKVLNKTHVYTCSDRELGRLP